MKPFVLPFTTTHISSRELNTHSLHKMINTVRKSKISIQNEMYVCLYSLSSIIIYHMTVGARRPYFMGNYPNVKSFQMSDAEEARVLCD